MGSTFTSLAQRQRWEAINREDERQRDAAIAAARRVVARKIVMTLVDDIVSEIIRPGPIAEERECYDMAHELRAIIPRLEELVTAIINVNHGVQ